MLPGKLAIFIIFSFILALAPAHAAGKDIGMDVGFDVEISETLATGPGSVVPIDNWTSLGSYSTSAGTITMISMSGSTMKYCPPVISNSGAASLMSDSVINWIKIDLATTPQTVRIRWYLDESEQLNYDISPSSSPYLGNSFKGMFIDSIIALFNAVGSHTIRVAMYDSSGSTLLAYDERSYEIVDCYGAIPLSLGSPFPQCLGGLPNDIPGNFTGDGSGTNGYWTDELEDVVSGNIPEGSFNGAYVVPYAMLNTIYSTAGFHYLRLDALVPPTLVSPDSGDVYASRTTIFNIQPCSSLSGTVTTSGGAPLQNVCVDAYSHRCGSGPYMTATTNSSGNYTFSDLPDGDYYVKTRAACSSPQDYVDLWYKSGGGVTVCDQAGAVTVASGQSISGINFSLSPSTATYPGPVITSSALFSNRYSDDSIRTSFWARISGPSPEDVASFTATGPSGTFNLTLLQPPFRQLATSYQVNVTPVVDNGTYTFVVTDSLGRTATVTRDFTYDSTVPQVDSATMTPVNQTYVGTTTPTLTWDPVSGAATYQPFIWDYDGKAIWYTTAIEGTSLTVPAGYLQPDTPYYWYVRVNDESGENRRNSNALYFYTGTKGLPDLSHTIPLFYTTPNGQFKWFAARNINLAPWDIGSFYVDGPDSTSYSYNSRSYRFQTPVYYASHNTGGSMPNGTYTFYLSEPDSTPVSKTQGFTYNPVPTVSEASMSPAPNAYLYARGTYSWDPVSDSRTLYYKVRISDYNSRVIWYESPYSTQTSWTVPEDISGLAPYGSYKWAVMVSDGNDLVTSNNIAFSSARTITKTNLSPSQYNYTLPGGTGVSTDYRMFVVPLYLGTLADVLKMMENTLGTYNPMGYWRVFVYGKTVGYVEINDPSIADWQQDPAKALWIINRGTPTVPFSGNSAPKALYSANLRNDSWQDFGLPWDSPAIELSKIGVTDGTNTWFITDTGNNLTGHVVWEYTGTGPDNGYAQKSLGDTLTPGTGFFIRVYSNVDVQLLIPPDNNGGHFSAQSESFGGKNLQRSHDEELPPPPPGAQPAPDIKTNLRNGSVTVPYGTPVSVAVSLDPGDWTGRNADWWIAVHTSFTPPGDWYSYVYPSGWQPGIHLCVQTPLFETNAPFEILNMPLPVGNYTFYFAVDGNADGAADATWLDSVDVKVE